MAARPSLLYLRHCESNPGAISEPSEIVIHVFENHVDAVLILFMSEYR